MPPKAKNRAIQAADVVTPGQPATPTEATTIPTVTVVARTHIAESINGQIVRFRPGQRFVIDAARASALGALVEVIKEA